MNSSAVILLSILAGVSFSLNAVAYRIGNPRKIDAVPIITGASLLAALLLGGLSFRQITLAPASIIGWGLLAGVSQYATNLLVRPALKYGPLSPLWCAFMLYFVPVVLLSHILWDEKITKFSGLAIVSAILAVLFATFNQTPDKRTAQPRSQVRYLAILSGILLLNSLSSFLMKYLACNATMQGQPDPLKEYGMVFLFCLYAGLFLPGAVDLTITRRWQWNNRFFYLCAGIMATGSIGGLFLQSLLMSAPSGIVFTGINATSIITVGLLSLIFFKEKPTKFFYLMNFFALAAILAAVCCAD